MKRYTVLCGILVSLVMLGTLCLAIGGMEIPAPFNMAKTLACTKAPNERGICVVLFNKSENGYPVQYILGYQEEDGGIVTIGKIQSHNSVIIHYLEADKKFIARLFVGSQEVDRQEITEDRATEFGFKVFRVLVATKEI